MKSLLAVALIAFAVPAAAQTAPVPAPAPAPAPAVAGKLTLDTPIETIMADPKGKAILTTDLGGDPSLHPMYDSFKGMSLNEAAPMSQGAVTDEMLKKIAADLAALK